MDMGIRDHSWRLFNQLATVLAINNYTVHLFDLNGFGYSGGKRFSPDESTLYQNFLTIINNINKSHPLFGSFISLCPRIWRNLLCKFFGGVFSQHIWSYSIISVD